MVASSVNETDQVPFRYETTCDFLLLYKTISERFVFVYFKAEQINLAKRTFCNAEHLKQVCCDYVNQYLLSWYR